MDTGKGQAVRLQLEQKLRLCYRGEAERKRAGNRGEGFTMQGNEKNNNCKKQERKVSQTQENEKTRKSDRDAGKDFTRNEERLKRFVAEIGAPDSQRKFPYF